jgi:hypothetical protein
MFKLCKLFFKITSANGNSFVPSRVQISWKDVFELYYAYFIY